MGHTRREHEGVVQSVTTLGESAEVDHARRTRRYLITMGIRTACFILAFITNGWIRWVFVAGAVVLPYVAVILANARAPRIPGELEEPDTPPDHQIER